MTPLEDNVGGSQDDDDDDDLPGLEDLGYESELVQIFASIVDSTTRLLRLSITIRNPAPHDRFLRAKATSTKHNEPWDIQHARGKFPQADFELVERLGKALSQRRQYFKYRESHHGRLAHGIGHIGRDEEPGGIGDDGGDDAKSETVFSTIASSLPPHLRSPADGHPAKEPAVLDEDEISETGVSQTSFATSTSTPDKLRIPKLPKGASDGPFECKFCYMIISAPNCRAWKRHVHADLQPYICLWKDCSTPHQQFQRRSHWLNHILQHHWRSWCCSLGCTHEFSNRESIKRHILDAHSEAASSTSVDALSSLGEKPRPFEQDVTCPLCNVELQSITEYSKHVGKHLVDIALFALPSGEVDDEETSDKETSESDIDHESDHESLHYIEEHRDVDEEPIREDSDPDLVPRQFVSSAAVVNPRPVSDPSKGIDSRSNPYGNPIGDSHEINTSRERHQNHGQNDLEYHALSIPSPTIGKGDSPLPSPTSSLKVTQALSAPRSAEAIIKTTDSGLCFLPTDGIRLHKVAQVAGESIIAQPHECPKGNECDRYKTLKRIVALINQGEDEYGTKLDASEIHETLSLLYQADSAPVEESGSDTNQPVAPDDTERHRTHSQADMSKPQLISLISHTEGNSGPYLEFNTIQRIWLPGSSPIPIGRYNEKVQPSNDPLIQDRIGFKSRVVSRRHCEVLIQDGRWFIKDVGSSAGTFLNHIRLSPPGSESELFPLHSGDTVQLGINFRTGKEKSFRCVRMKIFYETVEESFTMKDLTPNVNQP